MSWSCRICTYLHGVAERDYLQCSMCGSVKEVQNGQQQQEPQQPQQPLLQARESADTNTKDNISSECTDDARKVNSKRSREDKEKSSGRGLSAFDLLRKSKSPLPKKTKLERSDCPSCGRSFLSSFLQMHVSDCSAKRQISCDGSGGGGAGGGGGGGVEKGDKTAVFETEKDCGNIAAILRQPGEALATIDHVCSSSSGGDGDGTFLAFSEEAKEIKLRKRLGLILHDEFVSEEEESLLLSELQNDAHWKYRRWTGSNEGISWGVKAKLGENVNSEAEVPLPAYLKDMIGRIEQLVREDGEKGWHISDANAIRYTKGKGHFLRPHCDNRVLSKDYIVNLSLGCEAVMQYDREKKTNSEPDTVRVLLKRRSLQLMKGSARYNYTHKINNEDLLGEERISVTFRDSPIPRVSKSR